jgi:adenylate cyclase class 2
MEIEFEARVLEIDVEETRTKLKEIGATFLINRLMKRKVYDVDEKDVHKWIRLRDDGEKVTLTVKHIEHDGVDGTKEVEIVVDDFDTAAKLINSIGFIEKSYQENKRESWTLDGVRIELDTWPGLKTFMEIEADTKDEVYATAKKLGYEESDLTTRDVMSIYEDAGKSIADAPLVSFDTIK